jgi:hypothetical protein
VAGEREAGLALLGPREFSEADRLRAEIERSGWEIRDVVDGFELVRK